VIRISIPALTEERRKELVRQVRQEGETAKVSVRNTRREANEELKRMQKDGLPEDEVKVGESDIQKMTDDFSVKIDRVIEGKDKEIMTV
jgi:ribosome recycling factor